MKIKRNKQTNTVLKITALAVIWAMLFSDFAAAADAGLTAKSHREETATLAPQAQINASLVRMVFNYLAPLLRKKYDFSLGVDIKTQKERNPEGTRKVVIKQKGKEEIIINIPDWPDRSSYDGWITYQYGTMAIGNYPHLTTKLMIDAMLANENIFKNSVVLEAGVGDGMLAVLASRSGAKRIYGVDSRPEALDIARQVAALNKTDNIQLLNGDFINDKFDMEEKPTVLLLNIGVYIQETMIELVKKYPSVKHIILVGENLWVYGGNERLLDLLQKINNTGDIIFSNYFEQPAYYTNVFNEGYWSFVVELEREVIPRKGFSDKQAEDAAPVTTKKNLQQLELIEQAI